MDDRIHHPRVDPQQQLRILGPVIKPGHFIVSAHVRVHRAHAGRGAVGGGGVAIGDCQNVARCRGEASERIPLPVAVLRNPSHRERMKRLHHQRTDGREWEAAVAMHAPDDTGRPEQPAILRALGDGMLVGARQRLHHPDLRSGPSAHVATIPASCDGDASPASRRSSSPKRLPMVPAATLGWRTAMRSQSAAFSRAPASEVAAYSSSACR